MGESEGVGDSEEQVGRDVVTERCRQSFPQSRGDARSSRGHREGEGGKILDWCSKYYRCPVRNPADQEVRWPVLGGGVKFGERKNSKFGSKAPKEGRGH